MAVVGLSAVAGTFLGAGQALAAPTGGDGGGLWPGNSQDWTDRYIQWGRDNGLDGKNSVRNAQLNWLAGEQARQHYDLHPGENTKKGRYGAFSAAETDHGNFYIGKSNHKGHDHNVTPIAGSRAHEAYGKVPESTQEKWHGQCAEVDCLNQVHSNNQNRNNGQHESITHMQAVEGGKGKPFDTVGVTKPPCSGSCTPAMEYLSIDCGHHGSGRFARSVPSEACRPNASGEGEPHGRPSGGSGSLSSFGQHLGSTGLGVYSGAAALVDTRNKLLQDYQKTHTLGLGLPQNASPKIFDSFIQVEKDLRAGKVPQVRLGLGQLNNMLNVLDRMQSGESFGVNVRNPTALREFLQREKAGFNERLKRIDGLKQQFDDRINHAATAGEKEKWQHLKDNATGSLDQALQYGNGNDVDQRIGFISNLTTEDADGPGSRPKRSVPTEGTFPALDEGGPSAAKDVAGNAEPVGDRTGTHGVVAGDPTASTTATGGSPTDEQAAPAQSVPGAGDAAAEGLRLGASASTLESAGSQSDPSPTDGGQTTTKPAVDAQTASSADDPAAAGSNPQPRTQTDWAGLFGDGGGTGESSLDTTDQTPQANGLQPPVAPGQQGQQQANGDTSQAQPASDQSQRTTADQSQPATDQDQLHTASPLTTTSDEAMQGTSGQTDWSGLFSSGGGTGESVSPTVDQHVQQPAADLGAQANWSQAAAPTDYSGSGYQG
ncbi:hypothetical protein AB0N62_44750 [Streptomyces sp. NPDC093982]|uniref:hypothetical protein n=1 Tax=Streptomyces sp. NPDC093982 TaxID=3155077 RepID=UPI003424D2DF